MVRFECAELSDRVETGSADCGGQVRVGRFAYLVLGAGPLDIRCRRNPRAADDRAIPEVGGRYG